MRFQGRCYRGHDPAWSFSPISGDGASSTGGRFNRIGEPTLYLALDAITALSECTQGFSNRMQPLTLCEYDIDCEDIADLRTSASRKKHKVKLEDLQCGWLTYRYGADDAPSWLVADGLRDDGFAGILVPSFAPSAEKDHHNLILWQWGPDLPHQVNVYDPSGRLPENQLSWPAKGK
ncbi:RES family NAD+ phosphorylase [Sphingorhabdus sp. EL138]|uniref:RES family NAD+ phosphorylase n=1 Tax=Sphingorhabdus sp. EL138 TaxID=2073156 RepID=UPI000D687C09|nr:RES domain-containing protein [Sphingorhabdus sp. EL138]